MRLGVPARQRRAPSRGLAPQVECPPSFDGLGLCLELEAFPLRPGCGGGLVNRIPVLASDRGALPETLGDAGFVFAVPDRCTPCGVVRPTGRHCSILTPVAARSYNRPLHGRRAIT